MVEYRILPEQGLMLIFVWGTTSAEEIFGLSERLRGDPAFSPAYEALVDNTYLEHPPAGVALRELAEPRLPTARPDSKLAVIAPADAAYGASRMHQLLTESRSPLHIGVFRDTHSALEWLGKTDMGVEGVLDEIRGTILASRKDC